MEGKKRGNKIKLNETKPLIPDLNEPEFLSIHGKFAKKDLFGRPVFLVFGEKNPNIFTKKYESFSAELDSTNIYRYKENMFYFTLNDPDLICKDCKEGNVYDVKINPSLYEVENKINLRLFTVGISEPVSNKKFYNFNEWIREKNLFDD